MMFMNEYDVEMALLRASDQGTPNLEYGATVLHALMVWTNENSDGWPYWSKPCKAAQRLMTLLQEKRNLSYLEGRSDCTRAQVRAACMPIKSFLTRQGTSFDALGVGA